MTDETKHALTDLKERLGRIRDRAQESVERYARSRNWGLCIAHQARAESYDDAAQIIQLTIDAGTMKEKEQA